jgi:hypothetical protein
MWRPLGASHRTARQLKMPLHVTERGDESEGKDCKLECYNGDTSKISVETSLKPSGFQKRNKTIQKCNEYFQTTSSHKIKAGICLGSQGGIR